MLKKIISIVLLFILLLQVLPLQQVGYVLFSNQINEELPHGMEDGKSPVKKFTGIEDHFLFTENSGHPLSAFTNSTAYIFYSSSIPANHTGEIHTPPPNIG